MNKNRQADASIVHQDAALTPCEFVIFTGAQKVTAQAVSRMEIDLNAKRVIFGTLTTQGLDVRSGQELTLPPYRSREFIANVQNPGGFFLAEGTPGILDLEGIEKAVRAIAFLPDARTDRPATDVYAPIPKTDTRLIQYLFVNGTPALVLNPIGKMGVASIRNIASHNFLLALLVDDRGKSVGLITLTLSAARQNPVNIGNHLNWRMHGQMTKRNILTLGRPKCSRAGTVTIVAHLEGGYEAPITIQKHGIDYRFVWGDAVKTKKIFIGIVNGTNACASYVPLADTAELHIGPASEVTGAGLQYMHG